MSGLEKLVAKSVAARFGKRHDIPWRFLAANPFDVRARRASERFNLLECEQRFELQMISLADAMRAQHLIR